MSEPIYQSLLHHGEQDIDGIRRVWDDITGRFHHHNETVTPAVSPTGKAPAMSVQTAVQGIEQHLEAFIASAKEKLEQDLPVVADYIAKAAPIADAIGVATNLTVVPEAVQMVADYIAKLDAAIGAAKASGAAEAQAAAAAAAQPPAEPEAPAA